MMARATWDGEGKPLETLRRRHCVLGAGTALRPLAEPTGPRQYSLSCTARAAAPARRAEAGHSRGSMAGLWGLAMGWVAPNLWLALALPILLSCQGAVSHAMPTAKVVMGGEVFRVDVADTPSLQRRGLGGRAALGAHEGMLFLYPRKGQQSFWMRGMLIAIDIIWIANERIVHIEHRVPPPKPGTPLSHLRTYAPREPANAVLEIAAGRAKEMNVNVGDRVSFEF